MSKRRIQKLVCPKCKTPFEGSEMACCDDFDKGVFSQQARIEEITKETWSLGTERDELKARIRELEAELEARKKAWKEVKAWATKTRDGAIGEAGTSLYFNEFVEKLTALEGVGGAGFKYK